MIFAQPALALGEMSDSTFLAYVGALAFSGLLLLIVAALPGQSVGARLLSVVIALAMLGYAFYLFFIFDGGEVRIFFYVFIVPVLVVINAIKAFAARRKAKQEAAAAVPQQAAFGGGAAPQGYQAQGFQAPEYQGQGYQGQGYQAQGQPQQPNQ